MHITFYAGEVEIAEQEVNRIDTDEHEGHQILMLDGVAVAWWERGARRWRVVEKEELNFGSSYFTSMTVKG